MTASAPRIPTEVPISAGAGHQQSQILPVLAMCALPVIVLFSIAYFWMGGVRFPNDDAYIYLHNAQVLWTGHDSSYPGVSPLVGTTSAVFLAGLMFFECIIRDPEMALYVWCAVAAIAFVAGVRMIAVNAGCSARVATAIAVGSLLLGGSVFQLLNGLDTGLTMCAVAWDFALLTSKRRGSALAVLSGLMLFVRPELTVLSIASMAVLVADRTSPGRSKMAAIGLFLLAASPFALWYWQATGSPIPSTVPAKAYFFAEANLPFTTKIRLFVPPLTIALLAIFPLWVCGVFIRPVWLRTICVLFVLVFLGAYFLKLPGTLAFGSERYLFTLLPLLALAVAHGISSPRSFQKTITKWCIGVSIVSTFCALAEQGQSYREWSMIFGNNMRSVATWSRDHLPRGSVLLIHDAGYMAYVNDFRLVDMVGLKTPAAIPIHARVTLPSAGAKRGQAIAELANSAPRPQYLVDVKVWENAFQILDGLRAAGWALTKIYESPRPANENISDAYVYRVYALVAPIRSP